METYAPVGDSLFADIFTSIDFGKILDHPNILIAARFWEDDRYKAARVCYKFMRAIDDLVDNYKTDHSTIDPGSRIMLEKDVSTWMAILRDNQMEMPEHTELISTIRQFKIPFWPLEAFARSMIYDIYHDSFPDFKGFVDYAGGASVAPAAIFVHLCGLRKLKEGYLPPVFNLREAATPCAIFSYLVHIIRDFRKDHLHNLNYFPDDLMHKHQLSRDRLKGMAMGEPVSPGFREMIREICVYADYYRKQTQKMISTIKPLVDIRGQLSLEIIFALYLMVYERVDIQNGTFSTEELNPTAQEIKQRVWQVIEEFRPL